MTTGRPPIAAPRPGPALAGALAALALAAPGCRSGMYDQPRYEPLEASAFFDDGLASRPIPEGTVARGQLEADRAFYTGKIDGQDLDDDRFPVEVDRALLLRGRERYAIFCSPCHGLTGDGGGMIVQRGFSRPPSLHDPRLRDAPAGHYFDVITNGYGAMYSYASRVPPRDRWAITAYIRALQVSQAAPVADVPADRRGELDRQGPAGEAPR